MRLAPKRRDDPVVTRPMLWNIASTAAFFIVVMMSLLLAMHTHSRISRLVRGNGALVGGIPEFHDSPGNDFLYRLRLVPGLE